ncbi:MAG: hypothetical protein RR490_10750 [Niameybacter sp.]
MGDLLELMNRRQRQVLVHSFLYYQLNTNTISDHTFDRWSKELVSLMKANPELAKQTVYYEGFKEFDGSSGYDLPYSLPEIQRVGYTLLNYNKNRGN